MHDEYGAHRDQLSYRSLNDISVFLGQVDQNVI